MVTQVPPVQHETRRLNTVWTRQREGMRRWTRRWTRRWNRRLPTFSPPTDTPKVQLHTEQFKSRNQLNDFYTPGKWENTHIKMGRKGWDTVSINPNLGTCYPVSFSEEQRVWTPPLVLQLLRLPPKKQAPKSPISKRQWGYVYKTHRTIENKQFLTSMWALAEVRAQHRGSR